MGMGAEGCWRMGASMESVTARMHHGYRGPTRAARWALSTGHTHTLREGNQEPPTKKPSMDDKRHSRGGQQALVSKHLNRPCKTLNLS